MKVMVFFNPSLLTAPLSSWAQAIETPVINTSNDRRSLLKIFLVHRFIAHLLRVYVKLRDFQNLTVYWNSLLLAVLDTSCGGAAVPFGPIHIASEVSFTGRLSLCSGAVESFLVVLHVKDVDGRRGRCVHALIFSAVPTTRAVRREPNNIHRARAVLPRTRWTFKRAAN